MKAYLLRLLSDHGMIFVLAALCAFFSFVTLTQQSVTGDAAVDQVVSRVKSGNTVMLAVRPSSDESAYADTVAARVQAAGVTVAAVIKGSPSDARAALEKMQSAGTRLDAIITAEESARWLVITELSKDFPALGTPVIIKPDSYRWPNFLKGDNLLNIANQISVIAIIAIGMTMVIITAGIDLSVGSLLALAAVLVSMFIRDYAGALTASTGGMLLACMVAILACGFAGAFSGLMITRFSIPPFIVTLAMMLVTSGFAYTVSAGQSIYQIPDSFVWLGRGADVLGIPNAVLLMILLYGVAHIVMTQMRIGRHLYAVGGNREAAHISGVPVDCVLMFAYVVSGLLAGLGGVVMASQLKSGSPTYGGMYELYVIAAVVVGGTSLSGGKGTMLGTLTGAFIIAVIQNGMNLTNVESYTQKVVLGTVILGAVLADKLRRK
ncbi:ribose transport system permease protein [Prosthecobacter fusiformis]|uniref:Ribose transport system permease protein n=1 Tax=Prosthecobacter fusiformis TaxID=48464 RepID=A0A4R7S0C0_9BACT|nr:ABC transporter permease [Prosthecobacter fusiformis]TDU70595.1 ribose transport system permease protein [Prosthecobacter fusiformis]